MGLCRWEVLYHPVEAYNHSMSIRKVKIFFNETNINYFAWSGVYNGFLFSPYVKRFVGDRLVDCVTKIENDHGHWGVDLGKWFALGKKVEIKLDHEKLDVEENIKRLESVGAKLSNLADKVIGKNLRENKSY